MDDEVVLSPGQIEGLWTRFSRGEPEAREKLLSLHYQEFRNVARRVLNGDANRLQIQPTDLAHEAAIRIMGLNRLDLHDRTHFLALSARVMRQTLIDEVRRHKAAKRQAPQVLTQWFDPGAAQPVMDLDVFDDALNRLAQIDPERARIVELRFYAGLTLEEIAETLQISESTVQRRWRGARAWLLKELGDDGD
jgi:RNA polymerase sigma factor (TIGR02999 family)